MMILALDTSTSEGGVAVLRDAVVLSQRLWKREKSHSETVTAMIQETLRSASVQIEDLTCLALGKGPGSFTGIRIAVNAIKTIAFARNLPTMAFDTTEILAGGVSQKELPLLAVVNAHKNLLYTARFENQNDQWARRSETKALNLAQIEELVHGPHLCVGDGFLEYADFLSPVLKSRLVRDPQYSDFPQPGVLGRMTSAQFSENLALDWNAVQALYIRASEAEEKLRDGGNIKS